MNKKQFDCVQFKNELQENLIKRSGAKNLRDYVNYVNKIAQISTLHITKKNESSVTNKLRGNFRFAF
ncbi:MAG: hypothetical protein FWF51_06045 [Chitinivibrionia bacterium]|nr:hypothetical protein [Chitinivibrionia bacterium]